MKVLDLCCATGHAFEGWFSSEDDFVAQLAGGQLDCPMCGNGQVSKLPSAPRLNLGARPAPDVSDANVGSAARSAPVAPPSMAVMGNMASRFVEAVADLVRSTEDVGTRFAEEARRIHYGETEHKAIRGQTTPQERRALAEEGIEVYTLPFSMPSKSSLQ
ncbi:MAG TPA: DUF1178 family protein [Burkholderiaceae bacterium]|jgi:hypothetical protein|nr:DUF1178 family protein [Burkholderiaceae bacterium]